MRVRLLLLAFSIAATLGDANAQATNTGSANKPPEVFLDNHRPLVKKKDKAPTSRNVAGKVVDPKGTPLEGAVVTLTNMSTNAKTTFFTKTDGRYNFDDLSLNVDYQLQAKFKASLTEVRKVSQYDPNVNTVRILQVDMPEATAASGSARDTKQDEKPKPPQ